MALLAVSLAVGVAACDRDAPPRRVDSALAPAPPAPAPPPPPAATSRWDSAAGAALVVPGESGEALLVVPGTSDGGVSDTAPGAGSALLPARVSLFSRTGETATARAEALATTAGRCARWPAVRLDAADGGLVPPWTVGFLGGAASPVPLDSIEGLASGDSAQLAATVTRLAAALPGDTARAFRGLPFTVRSARRFSAGDAQVVVATLSRTVNQEDAPLAEQLLLVAEHPDSVRGAPWRVAYHERRAAREEALPWVEPLAAVRLGHHGRTSLVLAREYEGGSAYSLLEREGRGRWVVQWTSAYVGCPRS